MLPSEDQRGRNDWPYRRLPNLANAVAYLAGQFSVRSYYIYNCNISRVVVLLIPPAACFAPSSRVSESSPLPFLIKAIDCACVRACVAGYQLCTRRVPRRGQTFSRPRPSPSRVWKERVPEREPMEVSSPLTRGGARVATRP